MENNTDKQTEASKNVKIVSADEMVNNKYNYPEKRAERILDAPLKYNLIDIFKELKFGRPAKSQQYLQKCIEELETQEND